MAQPQAYNREVDFTERDGDDTNHAGINAELDAAALSINQIRDNLALIQKDDGSLQNGIVGAEQLAPSAFDAIKTDINEAVQDAQTAASSANNAASLATAARDQAVAAKTAAETANTSAALNATTASTKAAEANASASAAATSATASANSATASQTSRLASEAARDAAQTSQAAAAASQAAASASQTAAATSSTNAANSATAAATSATTATNEAATASSAAAAAAASLDAFDDRYLGSKTADPMVDNDGNPLVTGALYFNSVDNEMRVYAGTFWKATGSSVGGTINTAKYTATAGQTTFAIVYDVGFVHVYLNGLKLESGVDFTANNGTTVVLATAATAGDVVDMIAFGIFSVANTYTKAEADALLAARTGSASSIGFRNRIINGDMRIDQRNAGASVSIPNVITTFSCDRWRLYRDNASLSISAQQSAAAPTGFSNSIAVTINAGSAPAAGGELQLAQPIEGFNVADLGFGTASASTVTLSFWVRSSLTGTFALALQNAGASRAYVATYSINSANTWEYKTVTIPGDTAGTWFTGNGIGIAVVFDLGGGSNFQASAGSWTTGNRYGTSTSVKLASTTGATFNITGVQLEAGTVATPFERRPHGTELALCQRYYAKTYNQGTVPGTVGVAGSILVPCFGVMQYAGGTWQLPVTMRASPTVVVYSAQNANTTGKITSDATDGNGTAVGSERNVRFHRDNDSTGVSTNTFLYFQGTASAEL